MSAVPVQKPIIVTRPKPQLRIEQGTRPVASSKAVTRTVLFGALTLSFFFSSSLAGQVMVEKARRDGMHAVQRAKDANKEEALLRDKVQSMTRSSAIDAWALQHDLIAPENLVAQDTPDAQTVH
jgi:hypothetical protein